MPLTSIRWAGYVDTRYGGWFTAVRATWIQPRIRCDRPTSSVAFWIGLGGATPHTRGLEQIGTESECSEDLTPSYSAWYELIPAPATPIEIPITIAAGDTVSAELRAQDRTITFTIRNRTTQQVYTTQTEAQTVDLSSADWVAEAPSFCLIHCSPLPLADFRTVTFTNATTTTDAHSGPIDDPAWTNQPVKLVAAPHQPEALPSSLSADGESFSIRWRDPNRHPHRHR